MAEMGGRLTTHCLLVDMPVAQAGSTLLQPTQLTPEISKPRAGVVTTQPTPGLAGTCWVPPAAPMATAPGAAGSELQQESLCPPIAPWPLNALQPTGAQACEAGAPDVAARPGSGERRGLSRGEAGPEED